MIIAKHHQPGHWNSADTDYVPKRAWPENCYVQWGSCGVVLGGPGGPRQTAFFEVFPNDNAGSFIRGEGATIEEAETDAFAQYEAEIGCAHHWGRGKYANGGAVCRRCGAFAVKFKPLHAFGEWRKPLDRWEQRLLGFYRYRPPRDERERRAFRRLELREKIFGVEPAVPARG